jgi:DNA topoisomerase III
MRNSIQEIDLRIGASFTRFQTMLLRDAFVIDVTGDDRNLVLSYGPCQVLYYTSKLFHAFSSSMYQNFLSLQFPTLVFIVERFWEIQAHEPEEFWTINCTHTSYECTASFVWM